MVARRDAVTLAAPSGASGQQPARLPRLGFISTGRRVSNDNFDAFREGLRQAGQIEGQTFVLESRFGEGENDCLPALAAELLALPVAVFAVVGAVTVRAVRQVSASAPLLFTIVLDPVEDGLVASAKHPGGATSGVTNFDPAQARDQIRLLKQMVPGLERLAILGDPGVPDLLARANIAACAAEGIRPQLLLLRGSAEDLGTAFATIQSERAQALLGLYVPTVALHARHFVDMATPARLPTLLPVDWEAYNPLLTVGGSLADGARLMAGQADRVMRGALPGDLPIEVVTRRRVTVNQHVARQIGVIIPPHMLARADEVFG